MQDSVFTKIIKGEIPSYKIYEDELTFVFLDIHPMIPGHTLVVSKKQIAQIWDLPDEDYMALMGSVKKVALRVREVLRPQLVGEQIAGKDIPHVHVHVFPFNTMEEYYSRPDMSAEPDHASLAKMAKKLAF
jgi:histidine triad (HIT) family protein